MSFATAVVGISDKTTKCILYTQTQQPQVDGAPEHSCEAAPELSVWPPRASAGR